MTLTMTAYERDQLTPEARAALLPYLREHNGRQRAAPSSYTFELDGLEFEHAASVIARRAELTP